VVLTILKNMKVNGKDDNPYMKWKIKNVPNHQPVILMASKKLKPQFIFFVRHRRIPMDM